MMSWWKDGDKVHEGAVYAVSGAAPGDDGVYTCQAMNCIYGGDKEMIQESESIQVNVEEIESTGEALGTPCQVFGDPHIVTYDNKLYDYMGDCNYVLSMDCDWGEWVVYGNFKQCGPKDLGYPASCLIDVTVFWNSIGLNLQRGWIVVYRGEKVPLKYKGEVEVEGIKIQYDGLYITVILPNGIMVTWDGIISTQVILKKDSARNTCGLCGNNNKDPNDEFFARFQNDSPVSSLNAFGNSWEIDRMDVCDELGQEVLAQEFCDMYPERAAEGEVRCPEVFNNAVFDECRPFLSTDGYEEKCRYDFCALDEMREILLADCGVAAAYVQQCKAVSGVYISAAKWRAAVNCPTVAEHQNATVAEGCPQEELPWTLV
ncbi:kielin/chordin-like protein [Bolinopsis microptera]|uniref:kielin/chordin-like protein n=1 Tax=Bolinopsis microptera TaxID=2820187 RepID=UPI00307A8A91